MRKIIASGPVIIKDNKLLVTKDNKDDFYKIPGGKVEENESLEECAVRELKQETGLDCEIIKELSTQKMNKKPQTEENVEMYLHHYLANLKKPIKDYNLYNHNGHEVNWINIKDMKKEKYPVAPNIKFLIEKGDIK